MGSIPTPSTLIQILIKTYEKTTKNYIENFSFVHGHHGHFNACDRLDEDRAGAGYGRDASHYALRFHFFHHRFGFVLDVVYDYCFGNQKQAYRKAIVFL